MANDVLLYSGGLDSFIAAALLTPDTLLHVAMGGRYSTAETGHLTRPPGCPEPVTIHLPIGRWEREDLIVPGRNAFLVLAAANYGDTVHLAATAGDRVTDKDDEFAARLNHLLAHIYAPQWWLPTGRPVEVRLPFKRWTKREMVAEYLRRGLPAAALLDTFSCYAPTGDGDTLRECGRCKPCMRKWVALAANGVTPRVDASDAAREAVDRGDFNDRGAELADVTAALAAPGT